MRVTLDSDEQQRGASELADLESRYGGSPELKIDPETGQLMGTYIGRLEAIRAHTQILARRRRR